MEALESQLAQVVKPHEAINDLDYALGSLRARVQEVAGIVRGYRAAFDRLEQEVNAYAQLWGWDGR